MGTPIFGNTHMQVLFGVWWSAIQQIEPCHRKQQFFFVNVRTPASPWNTACLQGTTGSEFEYTSINWTNGQPK